MTNINYEILKAFKALLKPFIKNDKMQIIQKEKITQATREFESKKEESKTKDYAYFMNLKRQ